MSTSAFIEQLYSKFLYRNSDQDGKSYWSDTLTSGGQSESDITLAFVNSSEYQNSVATLSKLYFLIFDRIPDNPGLSYWVEKLQSGLTVQEIADAFAKSPEFTSVYSGATTPSAFVEKLYQNAFGRAADEPGSKYWADRIENGLSQASVITHFVESDEFELLKGDDVQATAIYHGILDRSPTVEELTAAKNQDKTALISSLYNHDDYAGAALPNTPKVATGKLIDGYIAGATVFADANGNGQLDEGESFTTTDSNGDYTLTGTGNLVAFGGTDISTGLAFNGVLKHRQGQKLSRPSQL